MTQISARVPRLFAVLGVLAVAGCTVGPDYAPPESAVSEVWIGEVNPVAVETRWWRTFNDPLLADLVERAIAGNKDLAEARARLREARALRDTVRGRALPEAGAVASATQNRLSENGQLPVGTVPGLGRDLAIFDGGFDASWEIDLWGGTRRAIESAEARAGAAEEARRGVVIQVVAEVVRAYIDLRAAQALGANASADAAAQQDIARLVGERLRVGLASRADLTRAETLAHSTAASVPQFAASADAAVRAERFLREFVQTLTRTFATLNTGFAIFDRQRNLQLFNPAIIELTGIRADFLASRPTLADFLDQLRELRMVPEPKDYPGWRRQINNLESAAANGHHLEEWSLPCGRVFRVQGSPHPDGAIALLFEDITSEIVIRREYREKLALNKTVLDQLDDSLAVFGPDGKLVLSNRSYRDNWSDEASAAHEALRRSFLDPGIEPDECGGSIPGPAGQQIGWSISQVSGGYRMLRFHAA